MRLGIIFLSWIFCSSVVGVPVLKAKEALANHMMSLIKAANHYSKEGLKDLLLFVEDWHIKQAMHAFNMTGVTVLKATYGAESLTLWGTVYLNKRNATYIGRRRFFIYNKKSASLTGWKSVYTKRHWNKIFIDCFNDGRRCWRNPSKFMNSSLPFGTAIYTYPIE